MALSEGKQISIPCLQQVANGELPHLSICVIRLDPQSWWNKSRITKSPVFLLFLYDDLYFLLVSPY